MIKIIKHSLALLVLSLFCSSASVFAEEARLNPSHPDKYYVKAGDTLWDISQLFLQNPWAWPEIWHINNQVTDPHLIYPGDEISLVYIDQQNNVYVEKPEGTSQQPQIETKPALMVTKRDPAVNVVKLSPQKRSSVLASTIPTLPLSKVEGFLISTRVVDKYELDTAPYILAADERHMVMGRGDTMYARGDWTDHQTAYAIFRAGDAYIDPETKEILGYEARDLGLATFTKADEEIATFKITRADVEIREYDRLLPTESRAVESNFYPKSPKEDIKGFIIHVFSGVRNIGQYDVVVINKGVREGVEVGDVFAIYRKGMIVRDKNMKKQKVQLPDERSGLLMVFRTFDKVSLALVLSAKSILSVGDKIEKP